MLQACAAGDSDLAGWHGPVAGQPEPGRRRTWDVALSLGTPLLLLVALHQRQFLHLAVLDKFFYTDRC